MKEQRDKASLQDSCNINNTTEIPKTAVTTRASVARKVSSKKSVAVLKQATKQTENLSLKANCGGEEVKRIKASKSNLVLGKIPSKKIKAKILKQPDDQPFVKRRSSSR